MVWVGGLLSHVAAYDGFSKRKLLSESKKLNTRDKLP